MEGTHFHCSCHYLVSNSEIVTRKSVVFQIEVHHAGENANHGVITKGINANNVEVPQEAGCHGIPPTTRRTHSRDELKIDEGEPRGIFQFIPAEAIINKVFLSPMQYFGSPYCCLDKKLI